MGGIGARETRQKRLRETRGKKLKIKKKDDERSVFT